MAFRQFWTSSAFGLLFVSFSLCASAQCLNTVKPSCDVYESCFARFCPCPPGQTEYFQSYGKKYCKAFLENDKLSASGRAWRDATLRCLQEAIVPHLDISETPQCDCAKMRELAFKSHVACYTIKGASICALGKDDMYYIRTTIGLTDLFDKAGWEQMKAVAGICANDETLDAERREQWKKLEAVLKLR